VQDARRANTNASLGCSVGRTEASEDNCAHAAHGAKEWLGIWKLAISNRESKFGPSKGRGHGYGLCLSRYTRGSRKGGKTHGIDGAKEDLVSMIQEENIRCAKEDSFVQRN
jgi:hypothetical protein